VRVGAPGFSEVGAPSFSEVEAPGFSEVEAPGFSEVGAPGFSPVKNSAAQRASTLPKARAQPAWRAQRETPPRAQSRPGDAAREDPSPGLAAARRSVTADLRYTARVLLRHALALTLATALLAVAGGKPSGPPHAKPLFWASAPVYAYPGRFPALEQIDWQNARLVFFSDAGKREATIPLRNGRYEHQGRLGHQSYSLDHVHLIGKPARYAVLEMSEDDCGGSCSNWGKVDVLRLSGRRLRVVQHFSFENRDGGSNFDAARALLTIRSTNYGPGAHCCPEYLDVFTFRWTGNRFQKISRQTIVNPQLRN
jgi:hypothetical protein